MSGKYGILAKLNESPAWNRLRIGRLTIGHAAFFPDVGDARRLTGPDAPPAITGDSANLGSLEAWLVGALRFWAGEDARQHDEIGPGGVAIIRQIFARTVTARPLLSARIGEEEEHRIELTRRQMAVLDLLSRHRHVVISGGAGTGKTLIAREKAERLAAEGMRTLLVCYNRPLADHIREQTTGIELLDVASFHQLCDRWVRRAHTKLGRDLVAEAICQREYSRSALVVAHKKKRSLCAESERLDPYIVFPLCIFGCDFPYEHRFLTIKDGKVARGRAALSETEQGAASALLGKTLKAPWSSGPAAYFSNG